MMPIVFRKPDTSAEDTKKAEVRVGAMTALVNKLSAWGAETDNHYKLLTPEIRAQLLKGGAPKNLVSNIAFFTEQIRVPRDDRVVEEDKLMVGFTADAFDSSLYGSHAIRSALAESHAGRCAYCETLIDQATYGDVEHFRPKAAYTVSPSPALFRPAYYFLAYAPENLFLSCQLCNEAYKQNNFPVIGPRVPEVTVDHESSVLINPYLEDPRAAIRFNPVNGHAYPFDLVAAFYAGAKGWGPPQTEQEIWKDPSTIPAQTDFRGQPISNPQVDQHFDVWLPKQTTNSALQRGIRTISILNLNRAALVRARVNHLRQLRCLAWTTTSTGVDQAAANQLSAALLGNDPARARVAPEYLSLSIDALQTWKAGLSSANGTLESYNAILAAFVPRQQVVAPPPHNDALMYLVLASELTVAGRRRIVYITDKDLVYGQSAGTRGIFLAIDWDTEIDNPVLIKRGDQVVRTTTIRGLIDGPPQSLWRTFEGNQVWAVGEYLPVKPAKK